MDIVRKAISDVCFAPYNPRVPLRPGDDIYEALKSNIERFGLVSPIVWNQRTNNIVGGHQRVQVARDLGYSEIYVSIVDLDETLEKQLNLALNKINGEWDDDALKNILIELGDDSIAAGFTMDEIAPYVSGIDDSLAQSLVDKELRTIEDTFNLTLTFHMESREDVFGYIKENGKSAIVDYIIRLPKEAVVGGM